MHRNKFRCTSLVERNPRRMLYRASTTLAVLTRIVNVSILPDIISVGISMQYSIINILSNVPIFRHSVSFVVRIVRQWKRRFSFYFKRRYGLKDIFAYKISISGGMERIIPAKENCAGSSLPDSLIIHPGCYTLFDRAYECRDTGIYRFFCPPKHNIQRVVIDKDDPVSSALLLACIACRGNRDDALSYEKAEKKAMRSLLALTCGPLSMLIQNLLQRHGIRSRIVHAHTLERLNGYNDGHILLEVWIPDNNCYIVVDVDKKAFFTSVSGKQLSLFELTYIVYSRCFFGIERLSTPSTVDWSGFVDEITGINYQFYEAWVYGSEKGFEEMIRRACQVPVFFDNGTMFACAWSEEVASRLLEIGNPWILLTPQQFVERFYGSDQVKLLLKPSEYR